MGTPANINVKVGDVYHSVYVHWDGYPSYMLKTLKENYNTQEKAENLVSLGDMSYLEASNECPPGHSYDTPVKGYTVYYGRDRGESNVDMRVTKRPNIGDGDYLYLFENGEWEQI